MTKLENIVKFGIPLTIAAVATTYAFGNDIPVHIPSANEFFETAVNQTYDFVKNNHTALLVGAAATGILTAIIKAYKN